MSRRVLATALLVITSIFATTFSPASATMIFQQNSEGNQQNPIGLPKEYRIMNIETSIDSDNTDNLIIKVNFLENPKADLFEKGVKSPLLRIKIFKKYTAGQLIDGGYGDIWIDSPIVAYQYMGVTSPATVSTIKTIGQPKNDPRIALPDCQAESWLETYGQEPWIKFSVSMSCIKLPNVFSIVAYVDANQNFADQIDYKFAPAKPMTVDIGSITRPRPKESQVVTLPSIVNHDLFTTSIDVPARVQRVNLYGDSITVGTLTYNSLSPTICSFPNPAQKTLNFLSAGNCTIEVYAAGDANLTESNRATTTFTIFPIPKKLQELKYVKPIKVYEGAKDFLVNIYSTSNLPIEVTSLEPTVCNFNDPKNNPLLITIISAGTCELNVTQAGNDDYYPTTRRAFFTVEKNPNPTATNEPTLPVVPKPTATGSTSPTPISKITLTTRCKKGSKTQTVKGSKCPAGYKKY